MSRSHPSIETARLSDHAERRRARRVPAAAIADFQAWLAAGQEVRVVDLSATGVRFLASHPLPDAARLSVRVVTAEGVRDLKGRILRTRATGTPEGEGDYEVAVAFDTPLGPMPGLPAEAETTLPAEPREGASPGPGRVAGPRIILGRP